MQLVANKLSLLKSGSNSELFLYEEEGSKVILKAVPVSCLKESKHLENQYQILSKIQHENIIEVYKYKNNIKFAGITELGGITQLDGKRNILVIEYAQDGNLLEFYKRNDLDVSQKRWLFQSLCQGVEYLHCNYIVHRDLKLQNILICREEDQYKLKIADFGFAANIFEDDQIKMFNSFKGTRRGYMSPEIHQCFAQTDLFYDARKADVFALGVILFALLLGKLPFQFATKQNKIYHLIQTQNYDQFWTNHSTALLKLSNQNFVLLEQFKDLFIKMVKYHPQKRITIEEVLEHEWFQGKSTVLSCSSSNEKS